MRRNAFQKCYQQLQQYPRFKERYSNCTIYWRLLVNGTKDVNNELILSNKQIESVKTIEELSMELLLQSSKHYIQNFLLKANQQFAEILPTTYIF